MLLENFESIFGPFTSAVACIVYPTFTNPKAFVFKSEIIASICNAYFAKIPGTPIHCSAVLQLNEVLQLTTDTLVQPNNSSYN